MEQQHPITTLVYPFISVKYTSMVDGCFISFESDGSIKTETCLGICDMQQYVSTFTWRVYFVGG
jgi:hypothetical protein